MHLHPRNVAERLARDRSYKRRLRVANRTTPVIVSPDSQLRYLKPGRVLDRDLVELAEHHVSTRSVVWDVGANVGTFSFAAAHLATEGCVVAIEPDLFLAGLLHRTSQLRQYEGRDIRILSVAIADAPGFGEMNIARRGRASNHLSISTGSVNAGGVRATQLTPITTLDVLSSYLPEPDLIKVDVEGAEELLLRGATGLLEHRKPLIYIELREPHADAIQSRLVEHGYAAMDITGTRALANSDFNTLFVPR